MPSKCGHRLLPGESWTGTVMPNPKLLDPEYCSTCEVADLRAALAIAVKERDEIESRLAEETERREEEFAAMNRKRGELETAATAMREELRLLHAFVEAWDAWAKMPPHENRNALIAAVEVARERIRRAP